ncbi:MAG: hypothetical protein Q7V62_12330 [Actinomycetota bacterium]|nr:hypothetical protein [Actinomycetota bacterium]
MNDEELQLRLRRIDPAAGVPIEPPTGPRAAALMEHIMNTPFPTVETVEPHPAEMRPAGRPARRWSKFLLAGGAALALAGGGALAFGGGGGSTASSVEFSLGETADPSMTMCLPVTDYVPAPGLAGFRGVVTSVGNGTVTLDVSSWYAGGDADQVVLSTADLGLVALDGIEFVEGGEYLVAVLDGQVVTCGLSGPADPVLADIYDGWFAG